MNKSILDYPRYVINEAGEVTNVETGRKLKRWEDSKGYFKIGLYKDGKVKLLSIHRLVYQAFVGEIPAGFEIDHIDHNRTNNAISNIRLVTHNENMWNRRGTKGYSFKKQARKWTAQISVEGKRKHLGYFDTEEEARSVYLNAKEKYHVIKVRS